MFYPFHFYLNLGMKIQIRRLSDDELFALIVRVTKLHGQNYNWEPRISTAEMTEFLRICLSRAGADSMITPREMLRDYMTVLNILYQNENVRFADLTGQVTLKTAADEETGKQVPPPQSAEKSTRTMLISDLNGKSKNDRSRLIIRPFPGFYQRIYLQSLVGISA